MDLIEKNDYAAGILLYYFDTKKQKPYFLLGKDFRNKWSDFGGKNEISDKNKPINTASREFYEETMGLIYDYDYIHKQLTNASYIIGKSYMKKNYYMFLVKLNYMKNYNADIKNVKKLELEDYFSEKNEFDWFSIEDIYKHKDIRQVFFDTLNNNKETICNYINCVNSKYK